MENTPIWKIEWHDGISVGIPELDEEHKCFIGLVNGLNRSIIDRADDSVIKEKLQLIIDDALLHFDHEETLLKEWHYPGAEEHAQIHATILKGLQDIMSSASPDAPGAKWIESGLKIKAILIDHIQREDMKFINWSRNRGAGK